MTAHQDLSGTVRSGFQAGGALFESLLPSAAQKQKRTLTHLDVGSSYKQEIKKKMSHLCDWKT